MGNLDDLTAENLTGAVVLLSVLMVIGLIGNMHVFYVYAFRIKPANHRIYILFLSVQDTIACTILIPLRINTYQNLWKHENELTCQFGLFLFGLILTASAFTLLLVATDRYRKICYPLGWQINRRVAKGLCIVILLSACLCSWPVLALNELQTVQRKNVTIKFCGTLNGYLQYQMYHRIVMAGLFIASLCILITLYVLIFKAAKQFYTRGKETDTEQSPQNTNDPTKKEVDDPSEQVLSLQEESTVRICDRRLPDNNTINPKATSQRSRKCNNNQSHTSAACVGPKRRNISKKTTLVFVLITVLYFISYTPFISLEIFLIHAALNSKPFLTADGFIAIQTIFTSVFINSIANCFIYGCLDSRFRHEISLMYTNIRCKH